MPLMSATDAFRLPSIAVPGVESTRRAVSPQNMADEASRAAEVMLIREAQAGSRAAFDALVRQYDGAVLRLALRLTGSEQDAQDIHQEAFLKAYRYLQNFRFECSFYTWIYRIATNLCLDHLRRRKSRREDQAVIMDGRGEELDLLSNVSDNRSGANPARELDRKILGDKIQDALGKLTPRERMVFEALPGIETAGNRRNAADNRGNSEKYPFSGHAQTASAIGRDARLRHFYR
jgi:RNA polymerase sigma-70 factor (ECF subfamily)